MKQPRSKGGAVCWRQVFGCRLPWLEELKRFMLSRYPRLAGEPVVGGWKIAYNRTARLYVWGNAGQARAVGHRVARAMFGIWLAEIEAETRKGGKDAQLPY